MVPSRSNQALRILHLEDSLADHQLAIVTLRRARMEFTMAHADTLDGFVQRVKTEPFDVLLADYRLPGFTALDAWSAIADHPGLAPFILLSGAIGEAAAVDVVRTRIRRSHDAVAALAKLRRNRLPEFFGHERDQRMQQAQKRIEYVH